MVVSLWLPLLGALVHPIARAPRARVIATASAAAAPPAIGEPLQVWIDCGEEDGSVWADATVRSVDETSNEFTVWITEWDSLPEDDPAYEPAYEEGPYNAVGDDEWRRPAAADDSELDDSEPDAPVADVPVPHGAVIFDAAKHVVYDYDAEAGAVEGIAAAAGALERPAGMDNDDKSRWAALNGAVETLYRASADSPAPPVAEDPRLCGDWECVGCTSSELAERRGLTGLGSAPFTKLGGLFFSYQPSGQVVAREVLEFFGNPVILNELRGAFGFNGDGTAMQEKYLEADLAGQKESQAFQGATATLVDCRISADGAVRIGRSAGGVLVFKKLVPGQLNEYLKAKRLPISGGTYLGNPEWAGPVA